MIINELKLDRFRNLADATLLFSERGNLLIGDNGQGKTNLLEAVYYLTLLKSFRTNLDNECIRFGESYFSLRGAWTEESGRRESASVGYDGRRKKVVLAGEEKKKVSEAFGVFKSVILTPEDIGIVQGGPAGRRRYLDIVLSISSPLYLERLKRYKKGLATRNFLLRRPQATDALISPWEEEMAESGAFIICERLSYVRRVAAGYGELFARLSAGERAELAYRSELAGGREQPAGNEADRQRIREAFLERLRTGRQTDRERGATLAGPQTDELVFKLEGRPLRNYGSQGQQRTAVICLKMVEAGQIDLAGSVRPVLLLDDIFSELDRSRSARLLEELVEKHQSFITAPRKEPFFERLGHLPVKTIEGGVVRDG
ncbi:MAG: hypothetical protein A3F83_14830 [Candidatus Glassbacteria bacterium RIFCSPLOWO2_12_FULL_58_11]|uniref:DNA replication and repair protein RecF n=1 Tax=Candidatus Glassbacteria bacterium RIFCSPLOWO2_12_FULL_58_11 TaxID=1817867 RepID=A0A1F5Z2P7_9BACT|nr:MAG: hypothetical protein A3F83_14830 [Candidatus Glassbacteria bacterium RIFCSPLOWO2_12_FULL_58_11]